MEAPTPDEIDFFIAYFSQVEDLAVQSGFVCIDVDACVKVIEFLEKIATWEQRSVC